MEVKIKQGEEMLDATIEVVDGVMVVSPKEVKCDITKFKDGDVITCGHNYCGGYHWTCVLRGKIEYIIDNMFIDDYCSINCKGKFLNHNSSSDSATWVRYATEEEKQKLFDKIAEEGYEWDADKKELVKLKWKPYEGGYFWLPYYDSMMFAPTKGMFNIGRDKSFLDKGWCFKTKEECQEFCNRLNDAINFVKPWTKKPKVKDINIKHLN